LGCPQHIEPAIPLLYIESAIGDFENINMKILSLSISVLGILSMIFLANGCRPSVNAATVKATVYASITPISGTAHISVAFNGFEPPAIMLRAGATIIFTNNMATPMTLVGGSGFTGDFGGTMIQKNGSCQYAFPLTGTYVVSVSGQSLLCKIVVVP
jgi:hypothetical protein